ncbi:transposase [Microbacterium sp. zg.Y625]|uniref:transposase n=1 Tax=Microbacterium jiangjiandongii TaxID=3049071 RepID=UPI00214AB745|nr:MULTISPECIES: transposase [unclassified Microbacterium]MCR2794033.1 transposase [Microbacterium sp. zg.Y625]WIM25759.1 transposase [Microbacterium sp. zg-Y625]
MAHEDLDDVAAQLYALPPAEFTAARNARAAAAEPKLAKAVRALRKPIVSAYAVDLLVQEGQLGEALDLAAALREAQDDLDAAEMTRLSRQRRALVAALSRQAVDLARDRGVSVSDAAASDVESTIDAAVRDPAAAAAVMTGRLVRPLVATGVDPVDLTDAVGGSIPGVAERPAPPRDDLAQRRARRAAEKAVREAEREASEASRRLARVEATVQKARERADHLAEREADLRADLERVRAEAATAESAVAAAETEREQAAAAARAAQRGVDTAHAALDETGARPS